MPEKLRFEGLTLSVESVERSIAFFSGKLGPTVEWNALPAFAMLRVGTGTLGLLSLAQARKEGVAAASAAQKQALQCGKEHG